MSEEEMEKLTFEEGVAQLEQIVNRMETGDAALEESMRMFIEGTRLAGYCNEKLQAAQQQIEKITEGSDTDDNQEGL